MPTNTSGQVFPIGNTTMFVQPRIIAIIQQNASFIVVIADRNTPKDTGTQSQSHSC